MAKITGGLQQQLQNSYFKLHNSHFILSKHFEMISLTAHCDLHYPFLSLQPVPLLTINEKKFHFPSLLK